MVVRLNGTKITLYPLRGFRFHEPCWPMNMPERWFGSVAFSEKARPSGAVCGPRA
jgi:hypothetical protein